MLNELQPLSKEITGEIRNILEECRDGRRLHNQLHFASDTSCGTAHCIAGWKVHDDLKERVTYVACGDGLLDMIVDDCPPFDFNEWDYAQKEWALTDGESNKLFSSNRTFEEQFELLEKLERGERLVD